jgi:hypothetical protein
MSEVIKSCDNCFHKRGSACYRTKEICQSDFDPRLGLIALDHEAWEPNYETLQLQLQQKEKELEEVKRHLEKLVDSINCLINESQGVYGLHLNGDPVPWNDLKAGGRFEEWLIDLYDAEQYLND